MKYLTIDLFKAMLQRALEHIREHEDEYSRLDAILGDGDHGTAMVTAFSAAVKASEGATEFNSMLNDMGFGIMLETSGSTSTLLGAFFLGMSDHASGNQLDAGAVKSMFSGGLANVEKQTQARKGDKTMMDALIPAVEAMQASVSDDISELFQAAAKAAAEGAAQTVHMKANYGRARNYGERSIGHADSGATSWSGIFCAFAPPNPLKGGHY
ncbi:dihydroxyacetone kinase-like protein [Parabacteroides sp. PF5-5]|uniref:DAK2 domain-containing protein n=1 Tax=unclassified Parabacteroides TaxID=2649774 RepID=UPI002474CDBF|nr:MULTISPECIES: DAK2 domain-containing protein [unclassified Parabacteroides]MDH6303850.1 dihydroxyacetone kinase-like protein [Parabacteroides sp. PH5-39]MDH6314467.1 dihydroxyacetone kinase-like protein [Parabacteroides sp. PF5-13]MDH6318468.1 dihydroxyacetone kinase-like protein [Parabacteroides sp. PH5-13]MDH6322239.1 dihydroxyacetone kinase-like protein [Parabacteroides sp. PH5-8]MDH6325681.1 dihydroxyacetone kinase-like protein [Parabacteroides sp. PH5-41]